MDNRLLRPRDVLQWLLRDEFYTTLAAGSVNGTAAEPGPGTRVVVDTGSYLPIAGGRAETTDATGTGDPRLFLDAVAREAGRIGIIKGDFNARAYFGWGEDTAGQPKEGVFAVLSGTDLSIVGGATVVVGGIVAGTDYYMAVIHRSVGAYFLIKGGTFTNWTLLYSEVTEAADPLYIGFGDIATGVKTSGMDFIRVPDAEWLPQPELSDGFAAANGTLLNTLSSDGLGHAEGVATGIGAGGSGQSWSLAPDTYTIQTNKAINTPVAGATLWDGPAGVFTSGTYAWAAATNNTIANVSTALQITYVDDGTGATEALSNAADLSADLTVGTWYQLGLDYKISTGAASIIVSRTGTNVSASNSAETSFTAKVIPFLADHATTNTLRFAGMGGVEVVTIDNLALNPLTLSDLLALQLRSTQDGIMDADLVVVVGTQAGVAMNWDSTSSPANGVIAFHDKTNAQLLKCVAGTWTEVISAAATYSANAKIRVIKSGTTYSLFYNGAAVGAASTISDAGIVSGLYHGVFDTYASNTVNDVIFRPRGTSGEYARLDRYIKG